MPDTLLFPAPAHLNTSRLPPPMCEARARASVHSMPSPAARQRTPRVSSTCGALGHGARRLAPSVGNARSRPAHVALHPYTVLAISKKYVFWLGWISAGTLIFLAAHLPFSARTAHIHTPASYAAIPHILSSHIRARACVCACIPFLRSPFADPRCAPAPYTAREGFLVSFDTRTRPARLTQNFSSERSAAALPIIRARSAHVRTLSTRAPPPSSLRSALALLARGRLVSHSCTNAPRRARACVHPFSLLRAPLDTALRAAIHGARICNWNIKTHACTLLPPYHTRPLSLPPPAPSLRQDTRHTTLHQPHPHLHSLPPDPTHLHFRRAAPTRSARSVRACVHPRSSATRRGGTLHCPAHARSSRRHPTRPISLSASPRSAACLPPRRARSHHLCYAYKYVRAHLPNAPPSHAPDALHTALARTRPTKVTLTKSAEPRTHAPSSLGSASDARAHPCPAKYSLAHIQRHIHLFPPISTLDHPAEPPARPGRLAADATHAHERRRLRLIALWPAHPNT
ncbi:hypothetical protein HYPSUDRAFT_205350 [Hypholoma sublateritium FD-334 SS-4]|uniref:Uncharacterized protein n=1 Tax=Hypholoma sublateritium (strain FD-334 SS-4) TaxID=945553 RepID=A0A0D2PE96_HYPSF|nr:hypothetical protein HYPSUDRAFT_205350 [Hypholoma sublateritium FD-334 SS-4]